MIMMSKLVSARVLNILSTATAFNEYFANKERVFGLIVAVANELKEGPSSVLESKTTGLTLSGVLCSSYSDI